MERTGERTQGTSVDMPRKGWRTRVGLLLLGGTLALGGCIVVPARHAYAPAPAYLAPAPVYVAPAPVYVVPGPRYYGGWHRGRW
jgi:hypothetical protein